MSIVDVFVVWIPGGIGCVQEIGGVVFVVSRFYQVLKRFMAVSS